MRLLDTVLVNMNEQGNSMGVGGLKQQCPPWGGGEEGNGYFLELHNLVKVRRTQALKFVGKLVQKLLIYLRRMEM